MNASGFLVLVMSLSTMMIRIGDFREIHKVIHLRPVDFPVYM